MKQPWHLIISDAGGTLDLAFNTEDQLWAFVQIIEERKFDVVRTQEQVVHMGHRKKGWWTWQELLDAKAPLTRVKVVDA